jgi:predicted MFS family arabinose efflux permease
MSAMLCFTLLLTTWHGHTPVWQALFVFFGGFGTGIAGSAVFVDLAASVNDSEMAIASSGLYLSSNIGVVAGVTSASAVFSGSLKLKLDESLENWPHGHKVSNKITWI